VRLGYIENSAIVPGWCAAIPRIQQLLVEHWERLAEVLPDAIRLPGPPLLTIEDYESVLYDVPVGVKLVVVQGPAELLGG
jgi:hypothetical protein